MIPGRFRATTASATDVGMKRAHNEDQHAVWVAREHAAGTAADLLLVVCDGMGGAAAGEVASRLAVDAVVRAFAMAADEEPGEALSRAVVLANSEVWQHTQLHPELQGMGTTCTAVAFRGDEAYVAHVGDSRAYMVRGGRLQQLTRDHSLVAELVASNQLTAEEAAHDQRRNVVTRSVGIGPSVEVDVTQTSAPLQPGDIVLLCSDGLHTQLDGTELARIASDGPPDQACRDLIRLANERGGPDNITVVMARYEGATEASGPDGFAMSHAAPARIPAVDVAAPVRRRRLQMLLAALLLLTLALCALAWVVFRAVLPGSPRQTSLVTDSGVTTSWQ